MNEHRPPAPVATKRNPRRVFPLFLRLRVPLSAAAAVLAVSAFAAAQESGPPNQGVRSGNYNFQQTLELGYRYANVAGNEGVFDTFVNLGSGVRLFEHTLSIRSLNHRGAVFDNLYLSSFGYGGDPNDLTRLRMYKNKWYNFDATFRRDKNFWDFNLLANPLNPRASIPSVPITSSLHGFDTVRRTSDFHLIVLPQSRVRFRVGYFRNTSGGPSLSTVHAGTETQVFQGWNTTVNSYRFGFDFKVLPRTNFSYDQFLSYSKDDTSWRDQNLTHQLSNGTPVDLGVIFNTPAGQPCARPIANPATSPPTADPTCDGFLGYVRAGRQRMMLPTEQLSLQSNYFRNLNIAARFAYSSSRAEVRDFNEFFAGLIGLTFEREIQNRGPAESKRVSVTADWAVTWAVTDKLRIVDTFRFDHFRLPGQWVFSLSSLFPGAGAPSMAVPPNVFNPATCPSNPATCPQHTDLSPADVAMGISSLSLAQKLHDNRFQVEYDFTKRAGARLGYRYRRRDILQTDIEVVREDFFPLLPNRGDCAGQPLLADGTCRFSSAMTDSQQTEINEHALLLLVWTQPADALRATFDLELDSADRSFTRISPRQLQHYKLRASYKPRNWMNFGADVNVLEGRNNVVDVHQRQHNRRYDFTVAFEPNARASLEFGYAYEDIFSHTQICFVAATAPAGAAMCPLAPLLFQDISLYTNSAHFGYLRAMWKPVRRVTTTLGYAASTAGGDTLVLNPNAPPGPLRYNHHKPSAGLVFDFNDHLSGRAGWGYYGYTERAQPSPIGSRDFRGNLVTLAIRYAF